MSPIKSLRPLFWQNSVLISIFTHCNTVIVVVCQINYDIYKESLFFVFWVIFVVCVCLFVGWLVFFFFLFRVLASCIDLLVSAEYFFLDFSTWWENLYLNSTKIKLKTLDFSAFRWKFFAPGATLVREENTSLSVPEKRQYHRMAF